MTMPTIRNQKMRRVHAIKCDGGFYTDDFSGDHSEDLARAHFKSLCSRPTMVAVFIHVMFGGPDSDETWVSDAYVNPALMPKAAMQPKTMVIP